MSQRRFHSKSRLGCAQCKKSRTKCDETKPTCGRCLRIGVDCSLAEQGPDWVFVLASHDPQPTKETGTRPKEADTSPDGCHERAAQRSTSLPPGTGPPAADVSFTETEHDNLRLMHHYTLHTSKTLRDLTIPKNEDQSLWEAWAPELAMEHEFLLHGLLSISALHLALCATDPQERRRRTVAAMQHHDRSLTLFRPELDRITNANHDAVFAMFCIVVFYAFGLQRSEGTPVERLRQVLTLLRDSMAIAKGDYERMRRSRWASLRPPFPFGAAMGLPDAMEHMLSVLRRRACSTTTTPSSTDGDTDEERATVYLAAISALQDSLTVAHFCPFTAPTLTLFPMASPEGYWDLLQAGEPLAVAIVANYAVILHRQRVSIWMGDWGVDVIDAVRRTLAPEWQECVAWAVQETTVHGVSSVQSNAENPWGSGVSW